MSSVEFLFWFFLILGIYPYVLYPLFARLLASIAGRRIDRQAFTPRISILISAYNEAKHIETTVRNKLAQDYAGEFEILVASDGSSDGTDEIVTRIAAEDARVRLIRQEPRQGKTAALNKLIELATGEVVIFSDANSLYRADTVRLLVENFSDPSVGYVTGKMVYVNPDGSMIGDGCSAYMRYENWLRAVESSLGSIVGVDGGVDAVRRGLYRRMSADQLPDFVLPLAVVQQGKRVVYDERALLQEDTLSDQGAEFRMRVRVALRALWALRAERVLLFGSAGALFAWQLWSHKALRYMSFLPLGLACVLNVWLISAGPLYQALLVGQGLFWLATLLGRAGIAWAPIRFSLYFLLLNVASALAFSRFLRGERIVTWQPRLG
jgi:cellulose synthase/poly-beta-1,6-N-acetylglucosamine synthase-like glycosyltransferase